MKALSFRQPWAQLIALGARSYDIRSWRTGHRGAIFLHAAFSSMAELRAAIDLPWIQQNLKGGGYRAENLPRQALVAEIVLTDCVPLEEFSFPSDGGPVDLPYRGWVWLFENPVILQNPIPCPGRLGLFEVN